MQNTPEMLRQRSMTGRDPTEQHRTSTPLELLFDLCFVVAVSQAASALHHDLSAGHVAHAVGGYAAVFFAIWWAWMNFTWFASAYDTDDVPYRLLTFVQIVGVLVLATGVDSAFDGDFTVITVGYVIMRAALIAQWLRAAAADTTHRRTPLRYATALFVTQVAWIVRLLFPEWAAWPSFGILVLAEVLTPIWAERAAAGATPTPWHPRHIAERYGLFTIIVLGECILAAFVAIDEAITDSGISPDLVLIASGALVLVFSLWWAYFSLDSGEMLDHRPQIAFLWGYVHYPVFAMIAAFGAGIAVLADWSIARSEGDETFPLSNAATALTVVIPVLSTALLLVALRAIARREADDHPTTDQEE